MFSPCWVRLVQVLLVLLNTCLLLVGLLLAGVGGILVAVSQGSLTPIVQGIVAGIVDVSSIVGPVESSRQEDEVVAAPTDLTQLLQPTGIGLIVIGGTMLGIALIGYCAGSITILLKTYCVILLVVVVVEVILVALFFSGTLSPYVMKAANQTLVSQYVDITDKGIISMMWNLIMIKSECCGLTGHTDFLYTRHSWPRNATVRSSPDTGQPMTVLLATPLACCRTNGQFPKVQFIDDHCAITPTNNNSNFMTGCWDKVSDDLSPCRLGSILVCSAAIAIKVVIALMALFIARNSNKISPI